MVLYRFVTCSLLAFGLLFSDFIQAEQKQIVTIDVKQAVMKGSGDEKVVILPHMMASSDFEPKGSLVSYKLRFDLVTLPNEALGIYVRKMSLAGSVYVNGQFFGVCERGQLKEVRCLHRPYLFKVPVSMLKQGANELQFEIFANARQSNGLSNVVIGQVEALDSDFFLWRYWLQVDLMAGLSWLSGLLGVIALAVGVVLRKDSVYSWFGLTSLVNAVATASVFISRPVIDSDAFSWIIFASRFASGHLLILMFVSFFERLKPRISKGVLAYTLISVSLIWLSDNDRAWVTTLYLPLLLSVLLMPALMLYWTLQTRQISHIFATLMMGLITVASSFDWLRFTGESSFTGLYFIPYAYSGSLFMFGGMLLFLLATALIRSQNQSVELEMKVVERTAELVTVHKKLLNSEIERTKTQERQHMLQDMHDGFGSQLVIAKMMVEQNQMSQSDLGLLLGESIADLYLLVDTLGNSDNFLPNALVDFRFRTQKRLIGSTVKLHWNLEVDHAPEVAPNLVLQILRLVQEALNNALKHAKATHIYIDFTYDEVGSQFTFSVADDGGGIGENILWGRGQTNMMARARSTGGTLTVSNSHLNPSINRPGTQVKLVIPMHSPNSTHLP
jgi:signal transduction histidine kinase